jgi:predicted GNAT family acetyltransferase
MGPEVHDEPNSSRWVAHVEGVRAGVADYTLADGVLTLTHTVVESAYEGRGVGSALVRSALDSARDRGLSVVPSCPFVAGWIQKHPEYADLVA